MLVSTAMPKTAKPVAPRKRYVTDEDLAGIKITNARRRLFGEGGPTKLDLAVYYAQVGDYMLPHIIGRPVSLVRSPSGSVTDLFFQRHPFNVMPKTLATFEIKRSDGEDKRYVSVEDGKGFVALAQLGVIEFHIWGCHRQTIEKPDILVFDLDPGEGITWRNVVAAAKYVREALKGIGLEPFLKTSGGRGAHVVVPIRPTLAWKKAHALSSQIAAAITQAAPDTFTAVMGAENRKRRIFIDFHRNARSATAAAPYSLRARTNLPASAPVNWADVDSIDAPEDLNYSTLPGFLTRTGDPWAEMDAAAREIPASL
jgi:bifunctional non-homologous end joining protein LigD